MMLKKCAILGLAVLLVGAAALAWLFNETRNRAEQAPDPNSTYSLSTEKHFEKYDRWHLLSPEQQNQLALELDKDRKTKTPEQIAQEQQARLRADLDKLAAREMTPGDIADYLYGPHWEEQVEQHKKNKEQRETARTILLVCLPIGGSILTGCFIVWFVQCVARLIRKRKSASPTPSDKLLGQPLMPELTDLEIYAPAEDDDGPTRNKQVRARVPAATGSGSSATDSPNDEDGSSFLRMLGHNAREKQECPVAEADTKNSGLPVMVEQEQSSATENPGDAEPGPSEPHPNDPNAKPEKQRFTPRPKVAVLGRDLSDLRVDLDETSAPSDSGEILQKQAENLQEQLTEFKQMTHTGQQAARDHAEPLNNTLKDLAQQVSAIREYAASQQNRVEKLQDGYDWNIIRTFCLRVIRCIDNLENRMGQLADSDEAAIHLEEVRDELLFALESSGVEQFQLEVNSEYRGQEKLAEAVKQKENAQEPDQAGKIAKVIRPGYRYMIDEDSFKIVRTAQVKLFG